MSIPLTIAGQRQACKFDIAVANTQDDQLNALSIETVQVNIGLRCNLACHHCHVESSPSRDEQMSWQTMQQVLDAAQRANASTLDITGGAPEMHPDFRRFIDVAMTQSLTVIVRTNLTIMLQSGYEDLPQWFADRQVHLVASLPCYLPTNVDRQRGRHVYADSVEVIKHLNAMGYGRETGKTLDLVYNPLGPSLPPSQAALEQAYREALAKEHNIAFNQLYTITNIPIGRFHRDLQRDGKADNYMQLLQDHFNPATLAGLMCRHQLHVGHDGTLYDCDFNFALGLPAKLDAPHISRFDPQVHQTRTIATDDHCFACTAGSGSSCGGALVDS